MAVQCPYCGQTLALSGAKPGRYATSCPKCRQSLRLDIPADPNQPTVVRELVTRHSDVGAPPRLPHDEAESAKARPSEPERNPDVAPALGPAPSRALDPAAAPPRRVVLGRNRSVPFRLGDCWIRGEVGRGRNGVVYLARQLPTGRKVALKVLNPGPTRDAAFLATLTRDAYAASLVAHPNLVRLEDFGEASGTVYFRTEYVDGPSLADLVRGGTRLDAAEAAGYVLQAARALKAAHDQGMAHLNVKSENLLLSPQGVVKLADLGLSKTPELAAANEPDSGRDEPRRDLDIEALGRTLLDLASGPSTSGAPTRGDIPGPLSTIVHRMTSAQAGERFRDMGDVIRALETLPGFAIDRPFTPRVEDARVVEEAVQKFNASPSARNRSRVIRGVIATCSLMAVLCLLTRKPVSAGAFLGLALMTGFADFVVRGVWKRTPLFLKLGELASLTPPGDWLLVLAGDLVALVGLWVFHLFWVWVVLGVVALGIAVALNATLDRQADAERRGPREEVEALLRSLRRRGVDEDALRRFVCESGGDRWEEFFASVFGYEAKLDARRRWGQGGRPKPRPRFAAWRDPVAAGIDARVRARRDVKDRVTLQAIEERGLVARGENLVTARRKAHRAAEAMVALASEIRVSLAATGETIAVNHAVARSLREAATRPEQVLVDRERGLIDDGRPSRFADLLNLVAGSRARFLAGAVLLGGCLAWVHQNDMVSTEQVAEAAAVVRKSAVAVSEGDLDAAKAATSKIAETARAIRERGERGAKPMRAPRLLRPLAPLLSSFGAGAAGLILIVSAFFRGPKMALFAAPAAAIPLLGPVFGLPAIGGLDPSLAPAVIGVGVLAAGVLFGRSRR